MKHPWTNHEVEELRRIYPDMLTRDVAAVLGRSLSSIQNAAFNLGLSKSEAFKRSGASGRIHGGTTPGAVRHQFQKGMEPWNKGKKGVNGKSDTVFKPGQMPQTWKPIGTERINKDGHLCRKVADTRSRKDDWKTVARIVWEAANGPTPRGHIVVFRPGKKTAVSEEITLDKLECISRKECAIRNHPRNKSPELGKLSQLKGAINRQVNRIVREAQEKTT